MSSVFKTVSLASLREDPKQPRKMDDASPEEMRELAASIRTNGLLQPIIVRKPTAEEGGTGYIVVAGHRRFNAARMAGLQEVPVRLLSGALVDNPSLRLGLQLVENMQRSQLSNVEEAMAIERLRSEFGMSQRAIAELLGKSESAISKLLTLIADDVSDVRPILRNSPEALMQFRQVVKEHPEVRSLLIRHHKATGETLSDTQVRKLGLALRAGKKVTLTTLTSIFARTKFDLEAEAKGKTKPSTPVASKTSVSKPSVAALMAESPEELVEHFARAMQSSERDRADLRKQQVPAALPPSERMVSIPPIELPESRVRDLTFAMGRNGNVRWDLLLPEFLAALREGT